MGRKGKFKPLLVTKAERETFVNAFFVRIADPLRQWRAKELSDHEFVKIYWHEFMVLWRPKDWRSGRRYRSCPERAHLGYELWCADPARIELRETIPGAAELLTLQCEGKRVVTIITARDQFLEEINGRDPLSFLLHDLVHAYEFFADASRMEDQIRFYQRLRTEMAANAALQERLSASQVFAERFEYLIADMNSHPAHLEAYYQHILRED